MKEMTARLETDPELAAAYRAAHEDYIRRRDEIEELKGFPSAGGMPDRVKCLHVLVGHSLAAGPGVNPAGRRGDRDAAGVVAQGRVCDARGEVRGVRGGRPVTRVAAIDCGTNSIRLLVADVDPAHRRTRRPGPPDDDRAARARASTAPAGSPPRRWSAPSPPAGTTRRSSRSTAPSGSASSPPPPPGTRRTGTSSSAGSWTSWASSPRSSPGTRRPSSPSPGRPRSWSGRDDLHRPYLVVDIGGGSTEFVVGEDHVRAARSVDVGCVRMTERHLVRDGVVSDPPSEEQIAAMRADIEAALDLAEETVPLREARTLVGLAGSVTTVSAIAQDLPEYDSDPHPPLPGHPRPGPRDHRLAAALHPRRARGRTLHAPGAS